MEERDNDTITQNESVGEIDLIEIVSKLWVRRSFIVKITVVFALIGFCIAIFTPNEYTASTTLVPQSGEKRTTSSLSGLAAMAGINLGSVSSGEVLSPTVYPIILKNINFQKELIYTKFSINGGSESISCFEYFNSNKYVPFSLLTFIKKYSLGLPSVLIKSIKGKNYREIISNFDEEPMIEKLTGEEFDVIKEVYKRLSLNLNNKEGYFTISFTSNSPQMASEVTLITLKLLQKYITDFKIEKVKNNLVFVENSYEEARKKFEEKQSELARFRDSNKQLSSAISKTNEEKLFAEYNLLLSIYSEIAKQKEQAKIAINETTPILTIIEPVSIPYEKSAPKRLLLIISFAFIGIISSISWLLAKPFIKELINNIHKWK